MQFKVVWHEGLFMQAHHLQQQERYLEGYTWTLTKETAPFCFGCQELSIDEGALLAGLFTVRRAVGVMPDGTCFNAPVNQQLSLRLDSSAAKQVIHLCLPVATVATSEIQFEATNNTDLAKRFFAVNTSIADVLSSNISKVDALLAQPNLCLKLEKDLLNNETSLAIAKVHDVLADQRVILNPDFIPVVTRCDVSPVLNAHLSQATGLVSNRAALLAARLAQPAQKGVGEMVDFLALQLLNRYQTMLVHFKEDMSPHPLAFYHLLIQLIGESSTYFSTERVPGNLPKYYHTDLVKTFEPLLKILQGFLIDVLNQTVTEIPLQDKGSGYRLGVIADIHLVKSAQFVLAVYADVQSDKLIEKFPQITKIGAVERIKDLVHAQVPGVPLKHLSIAPRQLPFLAGYSYFELERKGEQWSLMEHSKAIAMHLSYAIPGMQLKLWAIKQ